MTAVRHLSTAREPSLWQAVGNTPLFPVLTDPGGRPRLWLKAEWLNPGGSVKDRAALWIVRDAEERGVLRPGSPGIIVEGTAGNTGIGLTMVGNSRGYRTIMYGCAQTSSSQRVRTPLFFWCAW